MRLLCLFLHRLVENQSAISWQQVNACSPNRQPDPDPAPTPEDVTAAASCSHSPDTCKPLKCRHIPSTTSHNQFLMYG
ncbi:uncharacterized protein V6R79_025679 [Siganus canaliculatus]